MKAVVFIGPTISQSDVAALGDFICLPPAAQGDVYKALKYNPHCIGIIDGYFDGAAAVWHKEILWAMSQGVHVFGASSMGALRAAELADFGMVGVGEIFNDYQNGVLEDDDEVALIHGPAELGYPSLCVPMVNLRATLEAAVQQRIMSKSTASSIGEIAKSQHYKDRTWDALITTVSKQSGGAILEQDFKAWLKQNRVDQKHLDAVAMLEIMHKTMNDSGPKHQPCFRFAQTNQWVQAVSHWDNDQNTDGTDLRSILDELRLQPDVFSTACDAAKIILLASGGGARLETTIDNRALVDKINSFRKQNNLMNRSQLDEWLKQNDLTAEQLEYLLAEDLRSKDSFDHTAGVFKQQLLNYLKLCGKYKLYALRARKKKALLARINCTRPSPADTGLPSPALLEWYFNQRIEAEIPLNIDTYLCEFGLKNRQEFYQMLATEFLYLQSERNNTETQGNSNA